VEIITKKLKLSQIKPNPQNPRRIGKTEMERLVKSLQEFPEMMELREIVIDENNIILGGNMRYRALKQIGEKECVAKIVTGLTPEQKREFVIKDNSAFGSWDMDALANAWGDLPLIDWGVDIPADWLTGGAGTGDPADAEPQIDRAEELNKTWGVKSGDLWQIGEHRLLCGDSTKAEDVGRIMGGEKADLCFTSPPYAAQREYHIGDFDWLKLMTGVSEQAISACRENASILVNLGLVHVDGKVSRYWEPWIDWMEENGQPLYGWYVWNKQNGLMGDWHGRLAPAHEWLFHFANKPARANKTAATKYSESGVTHYKKDKVGLRKKDGKLNGFTMAGQSVNATKVIDSVIRCQPQRGGIPGHPAPFSVEFATILAEVYSAKNGIIYDPFLGSGTTMVACQNLNRKCRGIEISPDYCAVILQRMTDAFPGIEIRRIDK
jgi:DNA modification methylase